MSYLASRIIQAKFVPLGRTPQQEYINLNKVRIIRTVGTTELQFFYPPLMCSGNIIDKPAIHDISHIHTFNCQIERTKWIQNHVTPTIFNSD